MVLMRWEDDHGRPAADLGADDRPDLRVRVRVDFVGLARGRLCLVGVRLTVCGVVPARGRRLAALVRSTTGRARALPRRRAAARSAVSRGA